MAEALQGSMASDLEEQRLMRSVLEHDGEQIKDGTLLAESFDYNLNSFEPDLLFEQLVRNYRNAQQLYGPTLIRALTGYDDTYLEKNMNIPEFRQELHQRISESIKELKRKDLLDREGQVTSTGVKLAALVRYTEELDKLESRGYGKQERKERSAYGEKVQPEPFKRGLHRFQDLEMRRSVKKAIRRGHKVLERVDLVGAERRQHSKLSVIYAVDSSGSMRGAKLGMAKKAGIALAYKAIQDKNDVGLVIFTSKVEHATEPGRDFVRLLQALTITTAGKETDIALTIEEAMRLFGNHDCAKHLVLLTDAVPTKTERKKGVKQRVLEAVSTARQAGVTISLVGIELDPEGEGLARSIVEIGDGKLYLAHGDEEIDAIILEDYEEARLRRS